MRYLLLSLVLAMIPLLLLLLRRVRASRQGQLHDRRRNRSLPSPPAFLLRGRARRDLRNLGGLIGRNRDRDS